MERFYRLNKPYRPREHSVPVITSVLQPVVPGNEEAVFSARKMANVHQRRLRNKSSFFARCVLIHPGIYFFTENRFRVPVSDSKNRYKRRTT